MWLCVCVCQVVVWSLKSCLTLCDHVDYSIPGFSAFQYVPGFAQTHVHWVSSGIQSSHPLSSPSPPAFNLSQHQGLFQWVSSLHQVVKILELQLQHQSFQWIFRIDFLEDWLVWSPCSPRDHQESSPTPHTVQKHQFFCAQPSLWSNCHIHKWLLEKTYLWLYQSLLAKRCFCFLICCLGLS